MPDRISLRKESDIFLTGMLILILIVFCGCKNREKVFTVGMAMHTSVHLPVIEGFKAGMAESGYIENKNIRYVYDGVIGDDLKVIDTEIKKLLSQQVDLLLTTGNKVSLRAKKAVEGTDIPIIIGASSRPVEEGLVDSLQSPGGNITGVRVADSMPKLLELLALVVPEKKKFYLPYNPDDQVSIVSLEGLDDAASQLGVKLVTQKIHSVEEAVAAIEALPEDIGAIYRVPSPTLDARNFELTQAAMRSGIPVGSVLPLDESVLITLASDLFVTGRQAARIAVQIMHGAKPADLPVETAEAHLTINLKTAEKLGINMPDDILARANNIIR
jgi:putative ABC transport system substrate-binding protein